jgi:hypothetical protein
VTNSPRPKQIVDVPARLRNAIHVPAERRTRQDRQQLTARWRSVAQELAPIRERIAALQDEIRALQIPTTLVMAENPDVANPKTNIRIRGSFVNRGDEVPADIPPYLGKLAEGQPKNRLALARWLVSRDNPLTARVTVNHIWETYFGRGIVETSEDFGTQGSRPSHPELLDWLASEFMDRGWDLKALHKLIVTSAAYRQTSHATPESIGKDPANILFSRGPRYRVEAEMVRDIALSVSGLLSARIGGPSVMPYQPGGIWDIPYLNRNDAWTVSKGEDRYRRGIYTFIRRTAPYPSLTVFDAPSREHVTPRRNRTDTPLQALTALNDPAFLEAAAALAERIVKEGGGSVESRVSYGFRLATSRRPEREELQALVSGWSDQEDYFRKHREEAVALAGNGRGDLASWILFSRSLLNLDETITRP